MKLSNPFKPKTPAVVVNDWLDLAAVQVLQDSAQEALKINEPVARLIALKAAIDTINAAMRTEYSYNGINGPLGAASKQYIARHEDKTINSLDNFKRNAVLGGIITGLAIGGLALTGGAGIAALAIAAPGGLIGGLLTMIGTLVIYDTREKIMIGHLRKHMPDGHPLAATLKALENAVTDVEQTLTLAEARQSSDFNRVLDLSPSLEERFTKEAQRAAIFGEVKAPEEIRPIGKPARRDIPL